MTSDAMERLISEAAVNIAELTDGDEDHQVAVANLLEKFSRRVVDACVVAMNKELERHRGSCQEGCGCDIKPDELLSIVRPSEVPRE